MKSMYNSFVVHSGSPASLLSGGRFLCLPAWFAPRRHSVPPRSVAIAWSAGRVAACLLVGLLGLATAQKDASAQGLPLSCTQPATIILTNSARLSGMVVPGGSAATAWFQWGLVDGVTNTTTPVDVGAGTEVVLVRTNLAGLLPRRAYQYQVVTSSARGVVTGAVQRFVTGGNLAGWGGGDANLCTVPPGLSNFVAVAGGEVHSFAVTAACGSNLVAWGGSANSITNLPAAATNVVAVGCGQYTALALKANDTVVFWGRTTSVGTMPASASSGVVAIGMGYKHAVVLKTNGTVMVWGKTPGTAVPSLLTNAGANVVAIAAAECGEHSLALRASGEVVAWGLNTCGQATVPANAKVDVVAIAAGANHSLAVKANGSVVAWGLNTYGQTTIPAGLSNVLAVAAGASNSLALTCDGTVWAWGASGQTNVPSGLERVVGIASGYGHSLAVGSFLYPPRSQVIAAVPNHDRVITLDGVDLAYAIWITSIPEKGTLYQYDPSSANLRGAAISARSMVSDSGRRVVFAPLPGYNEFGKPYAAFSYIATDGVNDSSPATTTIEIERFLNFTLPPTHVSQTGATLHGVVSPGGMETLYWFEWRAFGAPNWSSTTPVSADSSLGWFRASVTATGLKAGVIYQYRLVVSNQSGTSTGMAQFFSTGRRPVVWGNNEKGQTNVPPELTSAVMLAGGYDHLLAADAFGKVFAWGEATGGGTYVPPDLTNPIALAAGNRFSIAVKADESVCLWGSTDYVGTLPPKLTNTGSGFFAASARENHYLLLKTNGVMEAYGDGADAKTTVPACLSNVVAIGAGGSHSVALRADGTVVVFGRYADGQTNIPAGLSNVVGIAVGGLHSLALRADGSVVAWGAGTTNTFAVPNLGQSIVPLGLSNVVRVAAGQYHSLAIKADGTVAAWGAGTNYSAWPNLGQSDVPLGLSNVVGAAGGYFHSAAWVGDPSDDQTNVVLGNIESEPLIFMEGQAATPITSSLTVVGVGIADLVGASVSISGFVSGQDVLSLSASLPDGITAGYAKGVLALTGSSSVANYQAALRSVSYKNISETPLTTTRTVSFTVNGVTAPSNTKSRNIIINSVNDAPIGVNKTLTLNEDTSHTFTATDFGFTDPNDNPPNNFSRVLLTTLPTAGMLKMNGLPVNSSRFVPVADLPNLVFTPAANGNGNNYATFTFQVEDNGGIAYGGVNLDPLPKTLTINVTAVNDAPIGTDNAVTISEDGSHTFATADFGFTDPNDNPPHNFTAVKLTTLPTAGMLKLSGTPITASLFVPVADLPNLVFAPAANSNGNNYAAFTFQVEDDGGTANGGIDLDPSPKTMTVNVTAVNDAPVGANNTVTVNENSSRAFVAADFGFTDPNDQPPNNFSAVRLTTLPTPGTLTLHGTNVTGGELVPVADLPNFVFTPPANTYGSAYATLAFQVKDDGGITSGGVNLSLTTNVLTIDVAPTLFTNHPPVGTSYTVTLCVGSNHTFAAADFGFTDPSDNPANNFNAVKITTLPAVATGTLKLNGTQVRKGAFVLVEDLPNLVFTPATNACGSNYATFTFQVKDDGGTVNGGVNLDPSPKSMAFDLFPLSSPGQNLAMGLNPSGTLALTWTGDAGGAYEVQYADSFSNPVWTMLPGRPTESPDGVFTQEDPGAVGAVGRFYRVKSMWGACQ